MNAEVIGLCDARDFEQVEAGSPEALNAAARLAMQAAGLSLVCAIALDAVSCAGPEIDICAVANTSSSILFKCAGDIDEAVNLMG